jgi:hypothetical protein
MPRDGRYSVTINQNYIIGSTIIQVECNDSLHNTTEFVYGIVSSNYFTINNVSGVISLVINGRDLPESGPNTAIIYCNSYDNNLANTVQLAVTYQIENVHVPMFTSVDQVLNVNVREDHTEREGPIIAHLNVTDEDLDPCNIVTFAIVSGNDGNFRIGSRSGIIELNNDLDYDSHPEKYTLTIQATNTECGDRRYSDELIVCIYVVNIDDEHPTFQQHIDTFTFDERQRPLNFVQLRCLDPDSPGAGIVYEEGYAQNESPFEISHQTGNVSATENLDYEQQISYNLTFICYDVLKSNIRDTTTIIVFINPVNEHLPTVRPRFSFITLNYTAPIGTLLISARHDRRALVNITATDHDEGLDHGKIQFTLGQNSMYNSYFHMDSDSGDLMLIRQFDFDVCSSAGITSFTLSIVACDDLQNSSRYEICPAASCTILVETASTPGLCELMFVEKNYTINVSELALPKSELLQVHCIVPGGGPLQNHTIEIMPSNSSLSQTLWINKDRVILQEPLDYELVQNFTIQLNCSDSSDRSNITSLFIHVLPENDNPPHFEKPLYFFTIILPSSNKEIIGSITALDDDLQIGNGLTYSLVKNEFFEHDLEYFMVNKLKNGSAAISMIKYPSHDTHYVFDIIANDSINTAQSTVSVHILTGAEQCGKICIILLTILVAFMLITAAAVSLACVRFYCAKKRKQQQQRPVSMANMIQLQDKSDTMGYCTIRQGNSLGRQKDEAISQM